jgi:hypothetical protein
VTLATGPAIKMTDVICEIWRLSVSSFAEKKEVPETADRARKMTIPCPSEKDPLGAEMVSIAPRLDTTETLFPIAAVPSGYLRATVMSVAVWLSAVIVVKVAEVVEAVADAGLGAVACDVDCESGLQERIQDMIKTRS